jgi:hypothetical protein
MLKKPLLVVYSLLGLAAVTVLANVYWTQRTEVHASKTTVVEQRFEMQPSAPTPNPQDLKDIADGFSKAIDGE